MATYADDMIVDKKEQLEKVEGICLPDEGSNRAAATSGLGTFHGERQINFVC